MKLLFKRTGHALQKGENLSGNIFKDGSVELTFLNERGSCSSVGGRGNYATFIREVEI